MAKKAKTPKNNPWGKTHNETNKTDNTHKNKERNDKRKEYNRANRKTQQEITIKE